MTLAERPNQVVKSISAFVVARIATLSTAILFAVGALAAPGAPGPVRAAPSPTFIYTNNGALVGRPNSVGAFAVAPDGALVPVPGQPFPTGGTDGAANAAIDQIFIVGKLLYAANSFSGDVSGFTIDPATGVPTPVPGSPFQVDPYVSTVTALTGTPDGRFLFAAMSGTGFVYTFRINPDGSLSSLGEPLVLETSTAGARVSPDGRFLGIAVGGGLSIFAIDVNGGLSQVPESPFYGHTYASAVDFTATKQSLVAGGMTPYDRPIDAFHVASDGSLIELAGPAPSPYAANSGVAMLSRDDSLVFLTGTTIAGNSGFVAVYHVRADGSLTPVTGSPFLSGSITPAAVATDPDGARIYVVNAEGSVSVLDVAGDGSLTSVPNSPFPIGAYGPLSIAVYPSEFPGVVPLSVCLVDDASGDSFTEVVDSKSQLLGLWSYRIAASGVVLRGAAEYVSFVPGRSLVSRDADDPSLSMTASMNYSSRTGAVRVVERRGNVQHVLRDRNIADTPPCQ